MNKEVEKKLIRIDAIFKQIVEISISLLFAGIIIWFIFHLLSNYGLEIFQQDILQQVFKYSGAIMLVVFLLGVVVRLILSPFVKSDEERSFEEKVNYVLQRASELENNHQPDLSNVVSPLKGLTEIQKNIVIQMLRDLPSHSKNPNKINMAEVAHFLRALKALDYLEVSNNERLDLRNLRNWVAQITGKQVPSVSEFNEAYNSGSAKNKVNKVKDKIRTTIQ